MTILYEDQDLAVIDKPPGVVVNQAITVQTPTIQAWWRDRLQSESPTSRAEWQSLVPENFTATYGTPEEIFAERHGIVHRLDKDTSGVLLLAKNPGSLLNLLWQFKQRQVEKRYLCLVHGKLPAEHDRIDLPMARSVRDRKLFAVQEGGRPALTEYTVQQYFPDFSAEKLLQTLTKEEWQSRKEAAQFNGDFRKKTAVYQGFSLLECLPKTGRTHQIRVHLAHLKHPIVGDQLYVGKKRSKLDALWCPRQFLHAHSLTFTHPRSRAVVSFTAPLPADLETALTFLG